jgi:hypothetical protein
MRHALAATAASAVALLGVGTASASADQLFVTTTGSTTALTCPELAPCSIHQGIANAVDGDEVIVAPGTYLVQPATPAANVCLGGSVASLEITQAIDFHGADGQPRPQIVDDGSQSPPCNTIHGTRSSGLLTIRHLAVENASAARYAVHATGSGSGAVLFDDIRASSTGTGDDSAAVLLEGIGVTFRNGVAISDTHGIIGILGTGAVRNATVDADTAIEARGLNAAAAVLNVTNSIAIGATNSLATRESPDTTKQGTLNHVYTNYDATKTDGTGVGSPTANDQDSSVVATAPVLVDQPNGDYHQQSSSPTIDSGLDDAANGTADFDAGVREFGDPTAITDIGADEFGSARATVTTLSATGVGSTGATLRTSLNPNGVPATYRFNYGRTRSYGSSTGSGGPLSGFADQTASIALSGLESSTTYHFQVVGSTAFGLSFGQDRSFTTAASSGSGDSGGGASTTTVPVIVPPPAVPLLATIASTSIRKVKIKTALKKGLEVRMSCIRACDVAGTATISRSAARKYGVTSAVVTVARGSKSIPETFPSTVVLKFTKRAKSRLRKARSLRLTVTVTTKGPTGAGETLIRKIRLTR